MKPIRPLITEKSMYLSQTGWYSFVVPVSSRKEIVAREIGRLYHVEVTDIRTIKMTGKARRSGKKMIVKKRSDWKKAIVRLAKGQRIPVFDIGEEPKKA